MTAVLSCGSTTIERKAAFGAISIEANEDRMIRKKIAPESEEGRGISDKASAEGRWVNTIVRTRPMRLESDTATREDIAERIPVTKKREPRSPSRRPNLTWKKYVTNELDWRVSKPG